MTDSKAMVIEPIGRVNSTRTEPLDDDWDAVRATVTLDPERFSPDVLAGLDEFSHVEVVYLFDRVDPGEIELGICHPRGNPTWPKVGIFAQRAKMRPNRIGVTVCRLLGVDGLVLNVEGLDAIDGSPVLDIKPWYGRVRPRGTVRQPEWSHELMAGYWRDRGAIAVDQARPGHSGSRSSTILGAAASRSPRSTTFQPTRARTRPAAWARGPAGTTCRRRRRSSASRSEISCCRIHGCMVTPRPLPAGGSTGRAVPNLAEDTRPKSSRERRS